MGRRVTETAGGTTKDLYYSAGWQVLEERQGGTVQAQNVWSPVYVDALVLRDRDADGNGGNGLEERLYAQQDANFNVTALVSTAWAVVERFAYDPYGAAAVLDAAWTARAGGSAYAWAYRFQGPRFDGVSGLSHARRRDFSPTLGRWASEDPLTISAGDSNFYRFVGNNPAGFTDPTGMFWWWVIVGGLAAAGAGVTPGAAQAPTRPGEWHKSAYGSHLPGWRWPMATLVNLRALTAAERRERERLARSRTEEARLAARAKIVLGLAAGERPHRAADRVGGGRMAAHEWRRRFNAEGLTGLTDHPAPAARRRTPPGSGPRSSPPP
jgi:RHS repeat-associated protein